MRGRGGARARQRGWAAVITLLVALLIVAVLAGTILKQQGPPAATGAARVDAEVDASRPMERARALEQSVKEQAADRDKRIDDAAK